MAELNKQNDPLLHRTPLFDSEYENYKKQIAKQEADLKDYVDRQFAVEKPKLCDLMNIMQQLGEILNRPNLKQHVVEKYKKLFEQFLEYIHAIKQFFNENYENPPIPDGFTEVGGAIAWAHIIKHHLKKFYAFFQRVYIKLPEDQTQAQAYMVGRQLEEEDGAEENKNQPPEGYVCILEQEKKKRKEYEELIKTLRTYETNLLEEWCNHIQEIRMSLQSTVLVENKNKKLFVNFDTRIS